MATALSPPTAGQNLTQAGRAITERFTAPKEAEAITRIGEIPPFPALKRSQAVLLASAVRLFKTLKKR